MCLIKFDFLKHSLCLKVYFYIVCTIVSLRGDLLGANWRGRHYGGNLAGQHRLSVTS